MRPIISFDLDGTLVKPGFGDAVWLDGLPRIYAKEKQVSIFKAKSFFKNAYDTIGSDKREWYDLSFWINKYNLTITPQDLLDQFETYIQIFDDVRSVVQDLSKDHTLIISSGAMQEFIQKELEYTGLQDYFHHTFSSITDTKTVKKDPAFYTIIAQTLHSLPENIIHIGDSLDYDYHSARKAGFLAYFLDRNPTETKPFTLSSLEEFRTIIRIHQSPY